jgi:acetoacetyl-CoA synthetase
MGTADFYAVLEKFDAITDSLLIHTVDAANSEDGLLLCFVVLKPGVTLESRERELRTTLRGELSPRHVPDRFLAVRDIPRTLTGKKCEVPVKRILEGLDPFTAVSRGALHSPEALEAFIQLANSPEFTGSRAAKQ